MEESTPPAILQPTPRIQRLSAQLLGPTRLVIQTPPAVALSSVVTQFLMAGYNGMLLYGLSRQGKTTGIQLAATLASEFFGGIPFYFIPCQDLDMPSEGAFFEHLLLYCKHAFTSGRPRELRPRLTNLLVLEGAKSPIRTVILILDEAQRLAEIHFSWILNISNELRAYDVRLFVIVCGQPELLQTRDILLQVRGGDQIVLRFMVAEHHMRGILNETELRETLQLYDVEQYPVGEEKKFPQLFVPFAFDKGFRCVDLAAGMWKCLSARWRKEGTPGEVEVGMEYIHRFLILLLQKFSIRDSVGLAAYGDDFVGELPLTGYLQAIKRIRLAQQDASLKPRKRKH